jgi:ATP-dependent RNA helicase RhlE
VFTRTKHGADKVVRGLQKAGHAAEAIHGNKSQNQRERVLAAFRNGRLRTLIATDIAARGIDVDGVSHVVNYDLPNIPESYVHRIGRTARAGSDGVAISFCDHEERAYLRDIERLIRMTIPATDRRTGKPAGHAAPQPTEARHGGRPHRGKQQRGHRGGHGGGHGRPGNNGHRPHNGGNSRQDRPSQNGHPAHRQDATAGEPSGIGNVTFLKRPNEPRRSAGYRPR